MFLVLLGIPLLCGRNARITVFQNRTNSCILKLDITENVVAMGVVSARRILSLLRPIILRKPCLNLISPFPVIENSTDFSIIFCHTPRMYANYLISTISGSNLTFWYVSQSISEWVWPMHLLYYYFISSGSFFN